MSHKKFNPEKAEGLLSRERYQQLKPDVLLQRLGLRPGSTILDLGCGNGFFTFPAAVGMGENGMVIAADASEQMLALLNRRLPPDNVQMLKVDEVAMDIENNSVDGVVTIAVYHEFKEPQKNLAELKRVLRPGGTLLFLDWDPQAPAERGPSMTHRKSIEQVVMDLKACGFILASTESYTDEMWMVIAHTPA